MKPNERTEAVGVVCLYKTYGQSATFLHSGNFLLPLMPKSQCWCVDGVSKFALRAQMFIYRIELPNETDHDRACVEDFKKALSKVLLYERTACPFRRTFTTEAKEEPVSPLLVKRLTRSDTKTRKWAFDEGWRPEGAEKLPPPERKLFELKRRRRRSGSSSAELSEDGALSQADSYETLSTHPTSTAAAESGPFVVGQVKRLENVRTVSSPAKFAVEDPFMVEEERAQSAQEEDDSFRRDIAPAQEYISLGDLKETPDSLQARAGELDVQVPPANHKSTSNSSSSTSQPEPTHGPDTHPLSRDISLNEAPAAILISDTVTPITASAHPSIAAEPQSARADEASESQSMNTVETTSEAEVHTPSTSVASVQSSEVLSQPVKHVHAELTPSSSATTVKPRASQMLRDFRARRPSVPLNRPNVSPLRDADAPHYLNDDPLPNIPYGNKNQSLVGAAVTALMRPPPDLIPVMKKIAAKLAMAMSALAEAASEMGLDGLGELDGEYRKHNGRWIPGGWDSDDENDMNDSNATRKESETSDE